MALAITTMLVLTTAAIQATEDMVDMEDLEAMVSVDIHGEEIMVIMVDMVDMVDIHGTVVSMVL